MNEALIYLPDSPLDLSWRESEKTLLGFIPFAGENSQAFLKFIKTDPTTLDKIAKLRAKVEEFARGFPMPGFDDH